MKKTLISALSALALVVVTTGATLGIQRSAAGQADLPWMNTALSPTQRTELLLDAMTLDQKLQQIFNQPFYNDDLDDGVPDNGKGCDFTQIGRHIEGIPELAIPDFRMANGGTGIRGGDCLPEPTATALPAQISSAATFSRPLGDRWGQVLDLELRAWAHQVLWGPVLNLIRTPYGGRNNEFFSEDPYLTGVLASKIISGIQARGVSQATAKHFVANDSEFQFERWTAAIRVPSRAMHELYLLPFEMAVKDAKVASVMCAYGYVNFSYNCESAPLLRQTLRDDWGFDGYVFSDRRAQQSTVPSILAGTDVEVDEAPEWYAPDLVKAAIAAGQVTEADIDDMLRDRYIKMFQFGDFDDPATSFGWDQLQDELAKGGPHAQVAKDAAAESLVLLRNERKQLPLDARAIDSVALIGPKWFAGEATLPPRSGDRTRNISVNAPYEVTPQEGLQNTLRSLGAGDATVTYNNATNIGNAIALAQRSDVTILMVGDVARETWDKNSNYQDENPGGNVSGAGNEIPDLDLPTVQGTDQQELIPRMLDAVPDTVMVLKTQGQVNMPWINKVDTLVEAWYPGQEDGNVVADALFGVTNFSGKLPVTFGRTDREAAYQTKEQYPGYQEDTGVDGGIGRDPIPGAPQRVVRYTEGLKMGYRWYQATGTQPLFPFGYGLSYTTFGYSNLDVAKIRQDRRTTGLRVSYTVTNTGDVAGKEASQVYLRLPREARENFNRLVEFQKVSLAPGESNRVTVVLDAKASNHPFSYYVPDDPDDLKLWAEGEWRTPDGDFTIFVGGSSEDLPLRRTVDLRDLATTPSSTKAPSRIKKPTVRPKRVTTKTRARIKFAVVSGGQPAAGKVRVRQGGGVIGRATLDRRGIAKVRISRLKAGKRKVKLVYLGSEVSQRATRTLVIRVKKARRR
ncbi:beta-glucosidase [Nocardioides sp. zg-1228]|uniref:beta-glucosidase family protein n=1 Tax=Nocardioides sp. zg-1228 TaxID=2763008 RepID=UPI0016432E0D|nr:glycoside hydrolase family 3 C-terminal domain-containing protein [Nocardioides sp. zg-1228]MBC2935159.1 glycoside hydrolase family 3 C-terminal domain-containing protein [Nocardioides sp. zg-1228]QSF56973.1 glycoside hydrolase family 3 C-terminal domain-containing protein [Nocardioides sp. zg-1228]